MKILWTDGSANPNPGPGGYAVIEEEGGEFRPVRLGAEKPSTNIRMEGMAIGAAIKYAGKEGCEVHTDSEFWKNVLMQWAPKWEENGWSKKPRGRDVNGNLMPVKEKDKIKNVELVQAVYECYKLYRPKLVWTRGHAGAKGNEMADEFANKARKGLTIEKWEEGRK